MSQALAKRDTVYSNGFLSGYLERRRMQEAARLIAPGSKVLDIGCNEGRILSFLPADIRYVGLDISATAIERARQRYPDQQFLISDLNKPSEVFLEEHTFDAVIMLALIEHIDSPTQVVKNFLRCLKPDGILIITTPAPYGRRFHDWGARIRLFSSNAAKEHHQFLDRRALLEIAKQSNSQLTEFHHFLGGFNQLACFRRFP